MAKFELEYETQGIDVARMEAQADKAWRILQDPKSDLHREALGAGIDIRLLKGPREKHLAFKKDAEDLDPFITGMIVGAATVVARDVWKKILLPYLIHVSGIEELREKKSSKPKSDSSSTGSRKKEAAIPKKKKG